MTLEREGYNGPFVVECDECHEVMELECFDFHGALAKLKSRGWRPKVNPDPDLDTVEWIHLCPECCEL